MDHKNNETKVSKLAESLVKSSNTDISLFGKSVITIVGIGILIYSIFFSFMIVDVFIIIPHPNHNHGLETCLLVAVNLCMYGLSCILFFFTSKSK
jgi:hypothetical protein